MKIEKTSLQLSNVLSLKQKAKVYEWYLIGLEMRKFIVKHDYYPTGPIFFTSEPTKIKDTYIYNVSMPINAPVIFEGDDENKGFTFTQKLSFPDGLMFRHLDMDEPLEKTYLLLQSAAEQNMLVLEKPFLNIFLDVYNDGVIDVFAPIKAVK